LAAEKKELYRIVSRVKIAARPGMVAESFLYAVTYQAPDLPPYTLFIPSEKWSEGEEKKLILADIKRRRGFSPEIVTG